MARNSTIAVRIAVLLVSSMYAVSVSLPDEQIIRNMVNQAIERLNKGDTTAILGYWDDNADYVGVDGTLIKGKPQIQALFGRLSARLWPFVRQSEAEQR
jgi:hypothetical protein